MPKSTIVSIRKKTGVIKFVQVAKGVKTSEAMTILDWIGPNVFIYAVNCYQKILKVLERIDCISIELCGKS